MARRARLTLAPTLVLTLTLTLTLNPNPDQVHVGKLSAAIIEAVRRDFVKGERRLSPELAELTPQLLQDP